MSPTNAETLSLDIDLRVSELWRHIEELVSEEQYEPVMALIRAAYGIGYVDALREVDEGARGRLCLEHGFAAP